MKNKKLNPAPSDPVGRNVLIDHSSLRQAVGYFGRRGIKIKLTVLLMIFSFILTSGLGCQKVSQEAVTANKPVTLKYWRVFDDASDFTDLIAAYRAMHPNVNIEVRNFRYEEYERALLEAWAEDRGPDIVSIQNTWLNKYQSKLTPAPASVVLPFETTVKHLGIKEEKQITMQTLKVTTPTQARKDFLDVAAKDIILPDYADAGKERVYGLPLSVDTLAMFFNRDILNATGLPQAARTWTEFQNQVKKIVKQDKQGNIVQAGAAIGTAKNVQRSFDILSALMMQNGTQMTRDGSVSISAIPQNLTDRETPPADEALTFYTDFAYPAKEVYTWNDEMSDSFEAFKNNQVAYFFGYSYHLKSLKVQAPKLNYSYTTLPQIEGNPQINYANYWVEAVPKKTANANWAWDFVRFITEEKQVKPFLDKTEKPTALRSLVSYQSENEVLAPFVNQLLTAQSWYHGKDPIAADNIFQEMINSVVQGKTTTRDALNLANSRLQQTM